MEEADRKELNLFAQAFGHHQAGRLDAAERLYRRDLCRNPAHAGSLHLAGVVACQSRRFEPAIRLIARAAAVDPLAPSHHANQAVALRELGRAGEALLQARCALALHPQHRDALNLLGRILQERDKPAGAAACYRRALAVDPAYPEAHNNLGTIYAEMGWTEEAAAVYRRALGLRPGFSDALGNFAQLDDDASLRRILSIDPSHADALCVLARRLGARGESAAMAATARRVLALRPDHAEAWNCLGVARKQLGLRAAASDDFRRAAKARPGLIAGWINLGDTLNEAGQVRAARKASRTALVLDPARADGWSTLGNALASGGAAAGAVILYERAMRSAPRRADLHSNLLLALNNDPSIPPRVLRERHADWGNRHALLRRATHANLRDRARRLRIGYVSPDFRRHSVAYFFEPLLTHHDREAVEIFCYADVRQPDEVTARLRASADVWRQTLGMDDEALAERIAEDGIDILVDLAGHTAGNRLRVFSAKPAPAQISWLGYPNTTGLAAMDYRFVDAITDPPGDSDAYATEILVRLDGGFLCYLPSPDIPMPAPRRGRITFGSFNNPVKLTPFTLDLWARLLERVPTARLLLKGPSLGDLQVQEAFRYEFSARGIPGGRVELLGQLPDPRAHMKLYDEIDIALDPFPYNGTTTTCEALWMGVPVVTLVGDRHAARVGASLMTGVGLGDLVARTGEQFLDIAETLAGDVARRDGLRRTLRQTMEKSPLCDAPGFARRVEAAYRSVWQDWCGRDGDRP